MHHFPTVSFKRRIAALLYEALLVGAVSMGAALVAGMAAMALNPVSHILSSLAATLILLAVWWLYFKANWHKKGQTLPMRVWKIGLTNAAGSRPPLPQLRLRFMWACVFIVFIPMLVYAAVRHFNGIPPKPAFGVALIWWILPWGFAFLNPDRQFLYDFLAGTRLVDLNEQSFKANQNKPSE
ncbi:MULTISPECIES: RDD family protein [Neisseria]|uniref:RDD family protein n=1 Tax=Neisseria dumasiana TaxID=1931275 RepID=A0A1X3DIC4_9NEIS|nr:MULTISPECIES: RDD family protein [Neisseria]KPN73356.1 RDD family protein [Neisseria sp. 74A18]OSI22060.1 RDD family protein [Neisseria dumasiana]OSI34721.1 RDD family protein [Neisseria dumasiana]UOO85492.1 RDD family protein [Neisseria dumasiana]